MDRKRSILNVSISILSRFILLVIALCTRRLLIQYIGNEINGLNSLYTSVIGMMSVAELGIGSAIIFSMYAPIVSGDTRKVAALYCLYRKLYRIIGAVIFGVGLIVIPFLPYFIDDYGNLSANVYLTFFLTLISVVLSYLYSAKTSLIEAYKDNYIITGILTVSRLARFILQTAAILIWRSYTVFLICQILETFLNWALTHAAVRRFHGDIIGRNESLDSDTKLEVRKNVRAMFMHKTGTVLVNSIDSVIISGFIGIVILGKYSNYSMIANVVAGTIGLFFSPLTSVVGHLCAAGNPDRTKSYFSRFYILNYILGFVFFLGYYATADSIVALVFGADLEVSRTVVLIITLNQFISFMRKTTLLFRDASGTFYNDRYKPVAEGVLNLGLSLLFVNIFPEEYRVVGVIAATIVTTLLICHIVEPYIVFRHVFGCSPLVFCVKNYMYIALFTLSVLLMSRLTRPSYGNSIVSLLRNGFLSVAVSAAVLALLALLDRDFRAGIRAWLSTVKRVVKSRTL